MRNYFSLMLIETEIDMEEAAYSEGHYAYKDCVRCSDNPYIGVNEELARAWKDGWWDTFYEDQ